MTTYSAGTVVHCTVGEYPIDGGLFTLIVHERCTSTQRRREYVVTRGVELVYSDCRAHRGGRRAEPVTAEDYPQVRA